MDGLNDRQRRFVEEYLVDLCAARAAARAGYGQRSAAGAGARLKANPAVRAAIEEAMRRRAIRVAVTQDRVVEELARIAFADIGRIAAWDDDGVRLTPSVDLDPDLTACVAEIAPPSARGGGPRVKLHSKSKALETLARHLGMFGDKTEPRGDTVITVVTEVPEPEPPGGVEDGSLGEGR